MLYDNPETAIETAFLTLPSSLPIKAAIDRMAEQAVSCAIIVENKKLVGIFTERDVVRITNSNLFAETLTLGNLMTRDVITLNIAETKDIFSVSRLFSRNRVRHLPVLDEQNQVVGIVTPNSIRKLPKILGSEPPPYRGTFGFFLQTLNTSYDDRAIIECMEEDTNARSRI